MAGQIPNHKGPVQKTGATKKTAPRKAPAKKAAPSKAVAKKVDKLDTDLTPAKAKALTAKLHKGATDVVTMVKQAYLGRVWIAMGHKTWDEWIDKHFEGIPLALPREKRKATVNTLAQSGLSTRAIAAATGESQSTISRDIKDQVATATASGTGQVSQNDSPANGQAKDDNVIDIPPKDVVEINEPDPDGGEQEPGTEPGTEDARPVTGLDGKSYPATGSKTPTVVNVVSVARTLAKDLANLTVRFGALYDREDYEENKVDVDKTLQQSIDDFATEIGDRLPEPEPAGA